MKNSKKLMAVFATAVMMAGTFLTPAVSSAINVEAESQSVSEVGDSDFPAYDNQEIEILDAVIFGLGEMADDIGINSPDYSQNPSALEMARQEIYEEEPEILVVAAEKINSGDVNKVEEGMDDVHSLVSQVAERKMADSLVEKDPNTVEPLLCTPITGCAVGWYLYAAVAVHNTVAITALTALAAGAWRYCGAWDGGCTNSAVQSAGINAELTVEDSERLIANITRATAEN